MATEPGPLASVGLLLHGHNLQNLILEAYPQEKVSDYRFLDGKGEERNLLQGFGLPVLDQVAQLGLASLNSVMWAGLLLQPGVPQEYGYTSAIWCFPR